MKKSLFFLTLVVTSGVVFSQDDTLTSAQNYKEIVIQGQKKKNKDKTALQLQASTDKLLSITPGITLIKRGNFALEPTIRGLNAGQINTDRKSTRLNSSHVRISYAVFCLKKKKDEKTSL